MFSVLTLRGASNPQAHHNTLENLPIFFTSQLLIAQVEVPRLILLLVSDLGISTGICCTVMQCCISSCTTKQNVLYQLQVYPITAAAIGLVWAVGNDGPDPFVMCA